MLMADSIGLVFPQIYLRSTGYVDAIAGVCFAEDVLAIVNALLIYHNIDISEVVQRYLSAVI